MLGSQRLKAIVANGVGQSYEAEKVVQEVDDEVINVESSLNQAKVSLKPSVSKSAKECNAPCAMHAAIGSSRLAVLQMMKLFSSSVSSLPTYLPILSASAHLPFSLKTHRPRPTVYLFGPHPLSGTL